MNESKNIKESKYFQNSNPRKKSDLLKIETLNDQLKSLLSSSKKSAQKEDEEDRKYISLNKKKELNKKSEEEKEKKALIKSQAFKKDAMFYKDNFIELITKFGVVLLVGFILLYWLNHALSTFSKGSASIIGSFFGLIFGTKN